MNVSHAIEHPCLLQPMLRRRIGHSRAPGMFERSTQVTGLECLCDGTIRGWSRSWGRVSPRGYKRLCVNDGRTNHPEHHPEHDQ